MATNLSPVTTQWESLFILYATVGSIVTAVVIGWLLYNSLRYRAKLGSKEPDDAPKHGRLPLERGSIKGGLIISLVVIGILFPITLATLQTVDLIEHPPEDHTMIITVHGFQWGWKFVYPNGKEVVGELRVPKDEVVIFKVTSDDVFHNFGIYEFKIKVDAIPGRETKIWIQPHTTGVYNILCFELCGTGHTMMKAKMIVMEPSEFHSWYSELGGRKN